MPKGRNRLAEALQSNRDLRNQLQGVEWPLQLRIRELEMERDKSAALAKEDRERLERLEQGMEAAKGLIQWLLASGKAR